MTNLDAGFDSPEWAQWFLILRLTRHCKPSAFEALLASNKIPSMIADALEHVSKDRAKLIKHSRTDTRLGTWHLPMATWAFFVDGSHQLSQGFASEHFLSQPIGHAVVCKYLVTWTRKVMLK